ncbi:MAG: hypothetical protein LBE61_14720 [Burkholderiaceae bacterium]|jgi:hypothetical protein|nr:hypothetical protein [Burkholderiaceae bacterium]
MRQQYHFRPVGGDVHIWDVHRLVRLARDIPVERIALADIREIDEAYWFNDRHATTREIIDHMRLVQEADLSWPIIVCPEGRVMDGMHRVGKAMLQGDTHITAIRLPSMPAPDHINVDADALPYDDDTAP